MNVLILYIGCERLLSRERGRWEVKIYILCMQSDCYTKFVEWRNTVDSKETGHICICILYQILCKVYC